MKRLFRAILCWIAAFFLILPADAAEQNSAEIFIRQHPKQIKKLFQKLDLSRPEFKNIAQSVEKKNWEKACEELLLHYRTRFLELQPPPAPKSRLRKTEVDLILRDQFTLQGITATQPRKADGRLDWNDQGPKNDPEWAWMLNRHHFFNDLLSAWRETGNPDYAAGFDRYIRDWIESNPRPLIAKNSGSWRVMEAGRRLSDTWPQIYYGFQQAEEFGASARLMMLLSIWEQADFCMKHHSSKGNHLNAEMAGLASAAVYWPEFKDSKRWLDYAVKTTRKELSQRIYPDGSQHELSNHYQIVVARHVDLITNLLKQANHPAEKEFHSLGDKLWNYVFQVMKPDGHGPLNNDSDLENNQHWLREASIARNASSWQGDHSKSVFFPWAGHIVMRNHSSQSADWLFFDVGPLGTAHQHYDKLHLSLYANGHDVLVDSGRYTYRSGAWRRYFTGPQGHNVLIFDDGYEPEETSISRHPVPAIFHSSPQADFSIGSTKFLTSKILDELSHRRAVLYIKNEYWLVVDEAIAFHPHEISILWHFHPDCIVKKEDDLIHEEISRLKFTPVSKIPWNLEMIKGQRKPFIQGWYSPKYNEKHLSPTAIYSTKIQSPAVFGWLISKENMQVEHVSSKNGILSLRVTHPNNTLDEITVNIPQSSCQIQRNGKTFASF